ncbi:FAD-dependent oxidoreductase [Falsiroseomonas selenitidurans]|uniref:FAD-dependent oxidoreductase n=1 Tax=Falsiroseomonas selenitidurans TaxID=2716335 RepID=A0ABX1EB92_9PROT|nr:FAD-dependent oxidoreductase [Falsiroseomonas selenitidurans]NKC32752.1 FAD-dependent oxidoreductase [Falsiroseomonas selenitidurans]
MKSALVLGGGVMGLTAAWALARAGWSVRLLDQDALPNERGSSVDDHRLIRHAYGAARGYMRMIDPAYAAWRLLFAEAGEDLHVPTGVLALANAQGGWLAESRAALRADGHALAELEAAAVAARYPFLRPDGIAQAFHMASGGVLLARRIVQALLAVLAARGIAPIRARARAVDPRQGWLETAEGDRLSADLLVVAAGPWAPRLLPALAPQVRPTRQILVRLAPPPDYRAGWQAAPMLLDLAEDGGFYAVPPVAGTPLKIGDHRFAPAGDPEDPRQATAAEAEEILAFARPRLRDLHRYQVLSAAACYYDVEPAERFVLQRQGRGFVLSGFSGHGFKFAPLLGLALARAATDPTLCDSLAGWAAGQAPPVPGLLADLEQEIPA